MRNLIGLTLVLLGIFLMFIPSGSDQENKDDTLNATPVKEYIPINNATGMEDYYQEKARSKKIDKSARQYARDKLSEREFNYMDQLVYLESKWDPQAQNPHSTAYGIGQFLDQTWETVGYEKTDDPYTQIDAMIDYVVNRYGSFESALTAWYERAERTGHGWY